MEIAKLKERYVKELETLKKDILVYDASNNNELKIAGRALKHDVEKLSIIVDALEKRIPMEAGFEYDDEFCCPACNFEDDGYDVKTLKFCPDCGQSLKWPD